MSRHSDAGRETVEQDGGADGHGPPPGKACRGRLCLTAEAHLPMHKAAYSHQPASSQPDPASMGALSSPRLGGPHQPSPMHQARMRASAAVSGPAAAAAAAGKLGCCCCCCCYRSGPWLWVVHVARPCPFCGALHRRSRATGGLRVCRLLVLLLLLL